MSLEMIGMGQQGFQSALDHNEAAASEESGVEALFKPVLLSKPVAAASHPSWLEDDEAAALSTQSVRTGAMDCQQHVDLKPFKGRGAAWRSVLAKEAVDNIHAEMRKLSEETKGVSGRLIFLAVHVRASSGQVSLRWRSVGPVDKNRHIGWRDLEQWLAPLDWTLAQYYRTINAQALVLNERELEARNALRTAKKHARMGVEQKEIRIALPSSRKLPKEI